WLLPFVGMEGTLVQGTDELFRMLRETRQGEYAEYQEEILFYLGQIYSSIITDDSVALVLLDSVGVHCTNHPLLLYTYANLAQHCGKNEQALDMLSRFEIHQNFPFYFLHYKKAQLRLRKLDAGAAGDFRLFLENFKGMNYRKAAFQRLAWIALMHADEKGYRDNIRKCLQTGISFVDDDKEAVKEAESGEVPHPALLKSRMLFDGGYYTRSFQELEKISSPTSLPFRYQL